MLALKAVSLKPSAKLHIEKQAVLACVELAPVEVEEDEKPFQKRTPRSISLIAAADEKTLPCSPHVMSMEPLEVAGYLVTLLISLSVGYVVGAVSSSTVSATRDNGSRSRTLEAHDSSEVIDSVAEECKLVLVVRSDLGMSTGKIAAQCSHATLACYQTLLKSNPLLLRQWERTGQTKIALRCDSEEELLSLQAQAQSLRLCARSIQDAGRTQIAAGSKTVLGIGPGPARLINQVTGMLRLL